MADVQKGRGGTVILWIIGIIAVVFVLFTIKGGRDGCEANGRQTQGLVECVELMPSTGP